VTSDNPRLEDPLEIIAEIETGIDQDKIMRVAQDNPAAMNGTHRYMVIADREKAIETAIKTAGDEDIVLIAGKGHEDYQITGVSKMPFDDRVVAVRALQKRGEKI
jgi:UDP-N-acetylmuramoyl-L-alanyl-D-glutamate--2,6-diaminopimelate ligase